MWEWWTCLFSSAISSFFCFDHETGIINFKFFLMYVLLLVSYVSFPVPHTLYTFKPKNKAGLGEMKWEDKCAVARDREGGKKDSGKRNKDTRGQTCMVQTFLNFSKGGTELGNQRRSATGWTVPRAEATISWLSREQPRRHKDSQGNSEKALLGSARDAERCCHSSPRSQAYERNSATPTCPIVEQKR